VSILVTPVCPVDRFISRHEDYIEVELEDEYEIDTRFRESFGRTSKLPAKIEDNYRPKLVNDDEFEDHKKSLFRRIVALTKATVDPRIKLTDYLATTEERAAKSQSIVENGVKGEISNYKVAKSRLTKAKALEPAADDDEDFDPQDFKETDDVLCRWKFAFRDISENAREQNAPTMIRTRRGLWRTATPLEELGRSWVRIIIAFILWRCG
jgi:hypothetical protein